MVGRLNSGEGAVVGGDDFFGSLPPAGKLSPELSTSSDEAGAHRKTDRAGYENYGKRMLAGGDCFAGSCTPAKLRWSEVMVFWEAFLRQSSPLPEEIASSGERYAHRKTESATEINSGERMFPGGEGIVRALTPAKPP